ncbi:LysR family transcriptional regulator [Tritonibacter multivorans]|nr:LysR family transcriptional regulator [Tritonibacter multivorans]MDA7422017.1 LysR family transcriptional regulator [Tritonibacter multivorans]
MTGMKTFVAAVETGSFTAAAARMHLSPKLVSKYVGQLEDRLGVRLLHRTTRQLSITSAGQLYYARAAQLIEDLDTLEADVRADVAGLTGTLRLSAPTTFGELHLQPLLLDFAKGHPDLTFDLYLSDRPVDLAEEGFDLAIRIGALRETNMIARRLAQTQLWCVAHTDYLSQYGTPDTIEALCHHRCIRDSNSRSTTAWPFLVDGHSSRIPVDGPFMVNSAQVVRNLALAAQGIGLCPDYVVAEDVQAGRLQRLFPQAETLTLDIHAVFLENRHLPARVRAFVDFVARRLKQQESFARLQDD